jgi:hypothetical protein
MSRFGQNRHSGARGQTQRWETECSASLKLLSFFDRPTGIAH